MAVIKIVPMPGAVGDKGDEGAPGAQGPQGPAGQNGLPGTPALWSYQGAWNSSAAYAVGDVVVYQGQLYYTKSVTTAGTLPTNTTKFDLIAAKGADGTNGTNGTNGADGADGAPGAAGADFGIYYLGNYNPNSGYLPNIAVVRGSDGQLYLAKASGQLGDPVGNTAQWEVWIPKGQDGAPGATPFTLIGAYDNGASYNLGIAVYYNGGTYVRTGNPLNPGYPPEVGAINASWTPIAEKGEPGTDVFSEDGTLYGPTNFGGLKVLGLINSGDNDLALQANDADIYLQASSGAVTIAAPEVTITSNASPSSLNINTYSGAIVNSNRTSTYSDENKVVATLGDLENQLNYWDGVDAPQDPAQDGFLIVDGIVTGLGSNLLISASDRVFIGGNNGEFLNGLSTPENQIATIGDLPTGATGTFETSDSKLVTVTNGIITSIESLT